MNRFLLFLLSLCVTSLAHSAPAQRTFHVGVAKIDITPQLPIQLSGYAARSNECTQVTQHIFAKALAITDGQNRALLITVDNVGVPGWMRDELLRRLSKQGIANENLAICASHSHSCPMLKGILPNLFGADIPADRQQRIDRYSDQLVDKMEAVARKALKKQQPCQLSWGLSNAGFAANRRTRGGPVDHDVPVLVATDAKGQIRAIFANYACHCTTVTGEFNEICGDWAGYAQEFIEKQYPGSIALTSLGCGADSNPNPRSSLELARKHGQEIADSVSTLLKAKLTPIDGQLICQAKPLALPYAPLATRAQWETLAQDKVKYIAYHARKNLARLDRGEKLPTELPYLVQGWRFGNNLAMVFLPGEVVVDYSLRLKKELDGTRLWINAWANDVPCYIPSKRILKEGGYEGGYSMIYYDRPAKLAEPVEDLIINAVHQTLGNNFDRNNP